MIENLKNILREVENESCREKYADHDPALFRAGNLAPGNFQAGPAPVPIAPIGFLYAGPEPDRGPDRKPDRTEARARSRTGNP